MALDYPDWSNPTIPGRFARGGTGHKAIATTGTRVALRATTPCIQVVVTADIANAGTVYVGTSTVTNGTSDSTDGFHLEAGAIYGFPAQDLAAVYINGTAGDGVSYDWFVPS